jgi:methyl-accepting chemotaxis protein
MKLNFIKILPAWGFMLVSGLVISDVTSAMRAEAELMMLSAVPVMLVCILIAILTRRSIALGLDRLGGAIGHLARGRLDETVPGLARRDEIGVIGRGVEVFRLSMIEAARLRDVHEATTLRALHERNMLAEARAAVAEAETANRIAQARQRDAEAELALARERERADGTGTRACRPGTACAGGALPRRPEPYVRSSVPVRRGRQAGDRQ